MKGSIHAAGQSKDSAAAPRLLVSWAMLLKLTGGSLLTADVTAAPWQIVINMAVLSGCAQRTEPYSTGKSHASYVALALQLYSLQRRVTQG